MTPLLGRLATGAKQSLTHAMQGLCDRAWGVLERVRPVRWGTSRRAWREVLAYYDAHEQDGPDPAAFRRLIRRNGLPDWANPFHEGQEEHYRCHPLGMLAADVELILEAWFMDVEPEHASASAPAATWPTLAESHRRERQERHRQRVSKQARARVCWAMAVASGGLSRLRSVLHPDNLMAATTDAVLRGDLEPWGLSAPKVWRSAGRQGLVPTSSPQEVWERLKGPDLNPGGG